MPNGGWFNPLQVRAAAFVPCFALLRSALGITNSGTSGAGTQAGKATAYPTHLSIAIRVIRQFHGSRSLRFYGYWLLAFILLYWLLMGLVARKP